MKILIVGSNDIAAIENYYVKYFKEAGISVRHFTAETIFYEYYNKNILNKLLFKAGLSAIYNHINELFKIETEDFKPDAIWIFKGMQILPQSLKWVKEKKIKLLNYNPDNPFIFSGKGSGNRNVSDSIGLFDLHLTYNLEVKKMITEKYRLPVAMLPFGFYIPFGIYDACTKQNEIIKACFIGNPDQGRVDFISALVKKGIQIDIYGNNWNQFIADQNVKIHQPVYGNELWKTLRKYRVQLNLMRIHNKNSHNMRSFEVPGIGGIMVAPDTIEHQLLFENGKEVFLFKDVDSCALIIKELLAMPREQSDLIRHAARKRSVESGYDYQSRAAQALKEIKKMYD